MTVEEKYKSLNAKGKARADGDPPERQKPERTDVKVLECVACRARYSRDDVEDGLYWVETLTCSSCYADFQRRPYRQSCFGKPCVMVPTEDGKGRMVERGHDPKAVECSTLCVDRNVCSRLFSTVIYVR